MQNCSINPAFFWHENCGRKIAVRKGGRKNLVRITNNYEHVNLLPSKSEMNNIVKHNCMEFPIEN